jgi:cytoskeletal protein CcmA (bactofilin family)
MKQDAKLTIIGIGMHINGALVSGGDIRIDGRFNGELITTGRIVISKEGFIDGNIRGKDITIHGKAKGDYEALNNFHIAPGGFFEGFVNTRYMNVTETACFNGTCVVDPAKDTDEFYSRQNETAIRVKNIAKIKKEGSITNPAVTEANKGTGNADDGTGSNHILNNTISKIKSL